MTVYHHFIYIYISKGLQCALTAIIIVALWQLYVCMYVCVCVRVRVRVRVRVCVCVCVHIYTLVESEQ